MNKWNRDYARIGAFLLRQALKCLKQNKQTEFERFIAIVYVCTLAL